MPGPKPMSEEERKLRDKKINAEYYQKNKQRWRDDYLTKKSSDEHAKGKIDDILQSLTEKQKAFLSQALQATSIQTI